VRPRGRICLDRPAALRHWHDRRLPARLRIDRLSWLLSHPLSAPFRRLQCCRFNRALERILVLTALPRRQRPPPPPAATLAAAPAALAAAPASQPPLAPPPLALALAWVKPPPLAPPAPPASFAARVAADVAAGAAAGALSFIWLSDVAQVYYIIL
jgi:hypothetical protein